jgi:hypothetical protein
MLNTRSERVAQPVEHVTFNHGVLGSSPSALTNKVKDLVENGDLQANGSVSKAIVVMARHN